jgi:hypothetical protein
MVTLNRPSSSFTLGQPFDCALDTVAKSPRNSVTAMQRNTVRKNQQRLILELGLAEVYSPNSYKGNQCVPSGTVFWYPYDWKALNGFRVLINVQNQERNPRHTYSEN